jgi:hypothetical protein
LRSFGQQIRCPQDDRTSNRLLLEMYEQFVVTADGEALLRLHNEQHLEGDLYGCDK